MEDFQIPKDFVKDLYSLHDSDMDGGFFQTALKIAKESGGFYK
jgi:hypothetical protein